MSRHPIEQRLKFRRWNQTPPWWKALCRTHLIGWEHCRKSQRKFPAAFLFLFSYLWGKEKWNYEYVWRKRDLLNFRFLNFSFFFRRRLLYIFYTKIVDFIYCNFCKGNLQFFEPRIKKSITQYYKPDKIWFVLAQRQLIIYNNFYR